MRQVAGAALFASVLAQSGCGGDQAAGCTEPTLQTDPRELEAALRCGAFDNPDRPAVLLVHGTFTAGFEQYDWTWRPILEAEGHDVCTVTYPDRGFGDMQRSAEYVVHALRRMHAESGRRVAVIGHSQGVLVPRWAIRWWPSARAAVDDFIMLAGPNQGTGAAAIGDLLGIIPGPTTPEVFFQFASDSAFIAALNSGDETPGDIDYTAVYTRYDELVQPVTPVPTAAIAFGAGNPRVTNVLIQDVCPGRLVDHVTIGLLDGMSFALARDAMQHPGPADVARAGGADLCAALPLVPRLEIAPLPALLGGLVTTVLQEPGNGLPALNLAAGEPALRGYASDGAAPCAPPMLQ